ncbi:hypothetical protein O9992_05245 [Vibrio lentus]|nr:hypothetical protein [Vibrio lentus]
MSSLIVRLTMSGFRSVEITDSLLTINGKPLLIRGVNRHRHHPELGHTMTREGDDSRHQTARRNNFSVR